jgi:pimeloyl-ACP methyl ester carboxylesterase
VLLLAATAAACSDSSPGASGPTTTVRGPTTTTVTPTTTTTIALPPPVPIAWRACGRFDCATVTVPVDYEHPEVGTIGLAVTRRRAGDAARRIGSLLMNPGGPGSSGVRRVQRGFTISAEVAERFDIVGFDPRGVGASAPITCGRSVDAFRASDLAPDTPEEEQALDATAKAVADECSVTEGPRLAHLGTVDVARDVEVIRRALGEAQVSFVGLSYGTLIGLVWAEAYPGSVRAMVLDGVVDPQAGGETTSREQVRAIDDVLTAIDRACASDTACPLHDGGVLAAYDELARQLETGAGAAVGVGPTQLAYAAFTATYGEDHWAAFDAALADGLRGRYAGLRAMADRFTGLVNYATFALVTCLDAPHLMGPDAWRQDSRRAARTSARFGAILSNELLPCAFWPQSTYHPHPIIAPGSPPILVVGSTGDAATPYDQAVEVAETLARGVLLTVQIAGHVAIGDSPCATAAISRYLVDLTLPTATC